MAAAEDPGAPRPTDAIVDVLIIGAGASGAAVAWSLAETRMKILCLEQGDWTNPTEFPTNRRNWEARLMPTSTSTQTVARATPTIPSTRTAPRLRSPTSMASAAERFSTWRTSRAYIRPISK